MEPKDEEKVFYTFGMIKPDGMPHMEDIIKIIYERGLEIHYVKARYLTDELIDENYAHVKEKFPEDFYLLKESLKSGPVLLMLIYDSKGNAIENYRRVLGVTKSWEAAPDTIRGKFGDRVKVYKNTAHGSGNFKEAGEEILRFLGADILVLLESLRVDASFRSVYKCNGKYSDLDSARITINDANCSLKKLFAKGE